MRRMVFLLTLVSVVPVASAQLDVQVGAVCPEGTNHLVSIAQPNSTTGNPGGPRNEDGIGGGSLYANKVCVGNVEAPTMRDDCPGTPGFYLYSRGTEAHFSNSSIYPTEVCTGRLQVTLRSLDTDGDGAADRSNPCEAREKQLFSVSNHTNAHIGSPYNDFYKFKACGLLRSFSPESVEVRLSLPSNDKVRSDDETLSSDDKKTSFEYPYIASSDGSRVSALVSRSANTTTLEKTEGRNALVLSATAENEDSFGTASSAPVLIPFTQGGFSSVEQREDLVTEGSLLERRNPAFGFPIVRDGSARSDYYTSYLEPDFDLTSNLSMGPGSYQLELEKTGEGEIAVRRQ